MCMVLALAVELVKIDGSRNGWDIKKGVAHVKDIGVLYHV